MKALKIRTIFKLVLLALLVSACANSSTSSNSDSDEQKQFEASWESLNKHEAAPEWFAPI